MLAYWCLYDLFAALIVNDGVLSDGGSTKDGRRVRGASGTGLRELTGMFIKPCKKRFKDTHICELELIVVGKFIFQIFSSDWLPEGGRRRGRREVVTANLRKK